MNSHDTEYCRKNKDYVRTVNDTDKEVTHSFVFRVNADTSDTSSDQDKAYGLLVDCGATTHIINDKSKFVNFDKNFDPKRHFIELADGSQTNGVVLGRGTASVSLNDAN